MPLPAALGLAAISGGAHVAGAGINAISTGIQNRRSQKWSLDMYNLQRQHALQDWAMQNEYNSPAAQMQRFKDAGINPNEIISRGSAGLASPVSKSDVQKPNFNVPNYGGIAEGFGTGLSTYYDMQIKEAQIDNLVTENTAKLEEIALKQAQRLNVMQNTRTSKFNLGLEEELRDVSLEARIENLRNLKANTQMQLDENERKTAMNSSNLQEAAERILTMRLSRTKIPLEKKRLKAAIANLWKDHRLKELDIQLRKQGIMPSDPMWSRVLGRLLDMGAPKPDPKELLKYGTPIPLPPYYMKFK
jgi:hypothetical protein